MGRIFIIMGKSASGKDAVYKKLVEDGELCFQRIVGYTTRPIRENETNGVEYIFVDQPGMQYLKDHGKIIELRTYHTVFGEWSYFTVDDGQIDFSASNYILIGTLQSYMQIRKYYGEEYVYPIFLEVEDGLRLSRALSRERIQLNPKYSEMCRRFLADEKDFSEKNLTAAGVSKRYQNTDLHICSQQIIDDIKNI